MYSIQFSDWGLVLEFMGTVQLEEMEAWLADVQQLTGGLSEPFSVIVDVRQARPATRAVEKQLFQGLMALEQAGMERVAVVVREDGDVHWSRLGATRMPPGMRRVEAQVGSGWLVEVHAWVQRGIDPESDATTKWTKP